MLGLVQVNAHIEMNEETFFYFPQDAHSLVGNTDIQTKSGISLGVKVHQGASSFVIYDLLLKMNVSFQGRK